MTAADAASMAAGSAFAPNSARQKGERKTGRRAARARAHRSAMIPPGRTAPATTTVASPRMSASRRRAWAGTQGSPGPPAERTSSRSRRNCASQSRAVTTGSAPGPVDGSPCSGRSRAITNGAPARFAAAATRR